VFTALVELMYLEPCIIIAALILTLQVATEWLYVLSEPCLAVALAERQSSGRRSGGRDLATRAALGGDVPDGLICDSKQGIPTTEQEDGQRPGAMHQSLEPIRVAGIKVGLNDCSRSCVPPGASW
jgi:hypothetical protein